MIVTTTPQIEGYRITGYLRVVAGETIVGINAFKDMAAGFRNLVGGRSGSYEKELVNARETALGELVERAAKLGANAVVGVNVEYMTLGADNGMVMVAATGTAATIEPAQ